MESSTHRGILILTLAAGLTGCDGSALSGPTAPSTSASTPTVTTPAAVPQPWPSGTLLDVTLSGTVYEMTPTGRVPIEGVTLYCELCGADTHTWAYTDSTGFYRFTGVWVDGRATSVHIGKDGYADPAGSATTNAAEPVRCRLEGGHGERQYAFRRRAREAVKLASMVLASQAGREADDRHDANRLRPGDAGSGMCRSVLQGDGSVTGPTRVPARTAPTAVGPTAPSADPLITGLSGTYTLTVTAASACTELPNDLRARVLRRGSGTQPQQFQSLSGLLRRLHDRSQVP